MLKVCDLHIHSKYSRGASKNIELFNIAQNCKMKRISIIGTGDCFHPLWLNELKKNLFEYSNGSFMTSKEFEVYFILQTEIEAIFKNDSKLKKVHFILLFPNFEKLDDSVKYLSKFGNLS